MPEKYPIRRKAEQSVDDMAVQLRSGASSKLYPEVSQEVKAETLSNIIQQQQDSLARLDDKDRVKRVDLKDLTAVKRNTDNYLQACKKATILPSISGLSAALGYSRQWICKIAGERTEVGFYLSTVFAAISSCLEQMALMRQTDAATSIFLMKNGSVGMTDAHVLQAVPASMDSEQEMTKEQLEQWFMEDSARYDGQDD